MATRMIVGPYRPRFQHQTALQKSRARWDSPDALCPTTQRVDRLMTSIRRLPGQEMTLEQAREESRQIRQKIASRDWTKWNRLGWANGVEVRDA